MSALVCCLENFQEQVFLVVVKLVESTLGDTQRVGDVVHLDCADALCEEMLHGNLAYLCA